MRTNSGGDVDVKVISTIGLSRHLCPRCKFPAGSRKIRSRRYRHHGEFEICIMWSRAWMSFMMLTCLDPRVGFWHKLPVVFSESSTIQINATNNRERPSD